MVANKYAFLQITRRRFLNEWEAFKKVISRRDRKSGSAGMPRPISYAVFCLKKKTAAVNEEILKGLTAHDSRTLRRLLAKVWATNGGSAPEQPRAEAG